MKKPALRLVCLSEVAGRCASLHLASLEMSEQRASLCIASPSPWPLGLQLRWPVSIDARLLSRGARNQRKTTSGLFPVRPFDYDLFFLLAPFTLLLSSLFFSFY